MGETRQTVDYYIIVKYITYGLLECYWSTNPTPSLQFYLSIYNFIDSQSD